MFLIPLLLASEDHTWDAKEHYLWAFLEVNTGIVCASIPALKPFFVRYKPGLLDSARRSYDQPTEPTELADRSDHLPLPRIEENRKGSWDAVVYDIESGIGFFNRLTGRSERAIEDEMRLWSGNHNHGYRTEIGQAARRGRSLEDGIEQGMEHKAIHVTSETRVHYAPS
ncbi:hypothetical protein NX059_009660 [Plenodomus lindquistii]|nr:hypothetical protein NX059_009660 [Plenodomus lindquistii]